MTKRITNQQALSALLGKRLAIWRRAANMLVLHFGQVTRGEGKSWGEYALHVQCPWRLLKDGTIFVGSGDLYTPKKEKRNFDWDKWYNEGTWPDNLLEHRVLSVLKRRDAVTRSIENATKKFVVEKALASDIGEVKLFLRGGYLWECFPNSISGEHWRLLDFDTKKHFVVSGQR